MATMKNITMKQFNGTDYDTLYPKTKVEQVEGAYTQQQILANSTKTMFGLDENAVPDDALTTIKTLIDNNYSELSSALNSKAKIAVGSYVGTGVSGVGHDNRLTFPFVPKIVIIRAETSSSYIFPAIFVYGTDSNFVFETQSNYIEGANFAGWRVLVLTWNGTTLYWRCGTSDENSHPDYQLNENGKKYIYVAIG